MDTHTDRWTDRQPDSSIPEKTIIWWGCNDSICRLKYKYGLLAVFVFDRVEITVGKGENASFQRFLLLSKYFKNASSLDLLKAIIVW